MRGGSAVRQHIFGQTLARVGSRLGWQGLRLGCDLTVKVAGRIFAFLNREQRLAGCAIENINKALLGGLRDRRNLLAIARYRNQSRRRREVTVPDVMVYALEV